MMKMQNIRMYLLTGTLMVLLVLTGCTRAVSTIQVEKQPTATGTSSPTAGAYPSPLLERGEPSTATTYPGPDQSSPEPPLVTSNATSGPDQGTGQTHAPPPTLVPTLDPNGLAEQLANAFTMKTIPGTNGHSLTQITGWDYGYRSSGYCEHGPYRWLDAAHLLTYPNVGEEEMMGTGEWTLPVVIDLNGESWLPPVDDRTAGCSDLPLWSEALQALVSSQDGSILVSGLDGSVEKRIENQGSQDIRISPSGKILFVQDTWIDLEGEQEVPFNWGKSARWPYATAWSQDETRLFQCCYAYGDASSGESGGFSLDGLVPMGRGLSPGSTYIESRWVLSDTRSLILWDFGKEDGSVGFVPLFVPEAQAYVDVRDLAGIPTDRYYQLTSISPDGGLIWIDCSDQDSYLIDLLTFEKTWFAMEQFTSWSADSQFALTGKLADIEARTRIYELFSISDQQRQALSDAPIHKPVWNPRGHRLAYLSANGQTLVQVDAGSMISQSTLLPVAFDEILWSPSGDRLALVAQDGGLWQIETAGAGEAVQVSAPLPELRDVRWSPDGGALSFVSGSDLYVVK